MLWRDSFSIKKLDIFISISTVQSNQIHYKNKNKVSVNNNCIQSSLVDLNKIVFAVNRKHFMFRTVHSVNYKVRIGQNMSFSFFFLSQLASGSPTFEYFNSIEVIFEITSRALMG